MASPIFLFLYSKYSNLSNGLLDKINNSNIHPNLFNFNYICIDNKDIRKIISKTKNIKISVVPCIIKLLENGTVQKFEGISCVNFVDSIIDKFKVPDPPTPEASPIKEEINEKVETPIEELVLEDVQETETKEKSSSNGIMSAAMSMQKEREQMATSESKKPF